MNSTFQSRSLKITKFQMKKNNEDTDQHIFHIEHGALNASRDEEEIVYIFVWVTVQSKDMMKFPDLRSTILT